MTVLGIIFAVFITIMLFLNFEKYYIYCFVFIPLINHFPFPVLQTLSTYFVLISLAFVFLRSYPLSNIKKFPFKLVFVLMVISAIISNHNAVAKHTNAMIAQLIYIWGAVFVFWQLLMRNPQRVIKHFVNACLCFAAWVGGYSLFETITRTNPWMIFLIERGAEFTFVDEIRYGLKRSQGLFSMHTTNAGVAIYLLFIVGYALKYGYIKATLNRKFILCLLVLTVFFTGARSGIIALVFLLPVFAEDFHFEKKYIPIIVVAGLLSAGYLATVFSSISNTDQVQGSNSDMRETQLAISLYYFEQSPIYGNGYAFTFTDAVEDFEELCGAESLWFPVLIDQGTLGLIAYIFFFISAIYYCIRNRAKYVAFFPLSLLVLYTMTSVPNVTLVHAISYIIIAVFMVNYHKKTKCLV